MKKNVLDRNMAQLSSAVLTRLHSSSFVSAVGMYAVLQVGTVPDKPNIHNTLTIIGHRVGHQSVLH